MQSLHKYIIHSPHTFRLSLRCRRALLKGIEDILFPFTDTPQGQTGHTPAAATLPSPATLECYVRLLYVAPGVYEPAPLTCMCAYGVLCMQPAQVAPAEEPS